MTCGMMVFTVKWKLQYTELMYKSAYIAFRVGVHTESRFQICNTVWCSPELQNLTSSLDEHLWPNSPTPSSVVPVSDECPPCFSEFCFIRLHTWKITQFCLFVPSSFHFLQWPPVSSILTHVLDLPLSSKLNIVCLSVCVCTCVWVCMCMLLSHFCHLSKVILNIWSFIFTVVRDEFHVWLCIAFHVLFSPLIDTLLRDPASIFISPVAYSFSTSVLICL